MLFCLCFCQRHPSREKKPRARLILPTCIICFIYKMYLFCCDLSNWSAPCLLKCYFIMEDFSCRTRARTSAMPLPHNVDNIINLYDVCGRIKMNATANRGERKKQCCAAGLVIHTITQHNNTIGEIHIFL